MDEIVVKDWWFTNVECDNSTWQNKVNKLNDLSSELKHHFI